jgi:putative nucleotidyltransferase with HDIG domain
MVSFRAYLQTKVASRIFGLFFTCAVVPTITLTAGGYWLVTRELRAQAAWQMAQAGKITGALLLARLHSVDNELVQVQRAIENGRKPPLEMRGMSSITLVREGSPASVLGGASPETFPPVTGKIGTHLSQGRPGLLTSSYQGHRRVFLLRSLLIGSSRARLWAEISPSYWWGDSEAESLAPAGVDLCIYPDEAAAHLYCTPGTQQRPRGGLESGTGAAAANNLVVGRSSLFLGFDFAARPWTIVLEHPVISDTALEDFRRTVALTAILGLSLVVLASNVLLRQQLDPLARLQEGTRRLAGGDFGSPVEVATGDEFEDLAESFNSMAARLSQSIKGLREMSWSTLEALARTIDANSPWTAGHSERVTLLAVAIGRRMGLGPDEIDRLHRGGLLHDVGKIGISPVILDKPGALTQEERAIVQEHPTVGARILEPIEAFADVLGIVKYHHERHNGQGYPEGLRGAQIPLLARVTAVADVYDALVSERPYRGRWKVERARSHIADMAGILFDPAVVTAFLSLMNSDEWDEASPLPDSRRELLVGSTGTEENPG